MGKFTLADKIRFFIGTIAWKICLWSWEETEEQYLDNLEKHYQDKFIGAGMIYQKVGNDRSNIFEDQHYPIEVKE